MLIENVPFPVFPFFVVMITTPFAPRAPYIAAEDASFSTSIDSISFGLNVNNGFVGAPLLDSFVVTNGIPSNTYKGSLPALILAAPRTLIDIPPSTLPLVCVICTPANFPTKAFWTVATGICSMSLEVTFATASVDFLLLVVP